MAVRLAGLRKLCELVNVQIVSAWFKLRRLRGNKQQLRRNILGDLRGFSGSQTKSLAEPAQRLPQARQRIRLRVIGPEQAGERFASMRAFPLYGQICEERAHFVGGKTGDRLIAHCDPKRAKKVEFKLRHGCAHSR
jgi:hypothetical protein